MFISWFLLMKICEEVTTIYTSDYIFMKFTHAINNLHQNITILQTLKLKIKPATVYFGFKFNILTTFYL